MDLIISTLLVVLLTLAVAPLLLLGVVAVCHAFGWSFGDRVLAVMVRALTLQWVAGAWLNAAGGVALAGLGGWMAWTLDTLPLQVMGMGLVPFGLWRLGRGVALLKGLREGV